LWAAKAGKAAHKAAATKQAKSDRDWVKRRSSWVTKHGKPEQYAGAASASEIVRKVKGKALHAIRKAQQKAHRAYMEQGKHGGGNAFVIAEGIQRSLGAELAAMMPQLWWYH
jgi:hypothetical protein